MDLDRGVLARIDRKLLAGLDPDEMFRMVRVPVTEAKWSTWKRYCDAAGFSMGRAIVMLLDRELLSVVGEAIGGEDRLFSGRDQQELAAREAQVVTRERDLKAAAERVRGQKERLRVWEAELETGERRIELATKLPAQASMTDPKVGRNERCSCGSGLKYKRCHGRFQ